MVRLFNSGALRHRNFRLVFAGNLVSLVGWWMHQVAQPWLVLDLTNSPFYVGLVAAMGTLPVTIFSLFGGVVADRYPKRRVIAITQTAFMAISLGLAAVVLSGVVTLAHVMLAALMLGTVAAFDIPGRQAFIVDLVGKPDLMNAIALNSSAFNASRVFGPAVAGVLIGTLGVGLCFLANGLSYIGVLVALALVRVSGGGAIQLSRSTFSTIREGLAYVVEHRPTRTLILSMATASVFGFSYQVLMPVFARGVLGLGAQAYGWMVSAAGAGALVGGLGLATFARRVPAGTVVKVASVAFGVTLILLGTTRSFPLVLLLLTISGLTMVAQTATTNTLLQTSAPDELRGRVMSVYTLAFIGLLPFGALLAGGIAERFGPTTFFLVGGTVCTAVALATAATKSE
jgi:MFS family permease